MTRNAQTCEEFAESAGGRAWTPPASRLEKNSCVKRLVKLHTQVEGFWALSRWEQRWLMQSLFWLPIGAIFLRLLGLRRCLSLAGRTRKMVRARAWVEQVGHESVDRIDQVDRAALLTAVAARFGLVRGTCLSRSLTLWWMLRSRGIPTSFRIGVRKRQERLEAHAWVEYQERILGDPDEVHLNFIPIGTWGEQQMPTGNFSAFEIGPSQHSL